MYSTESLQGLGQGDSAWLATVPLQTPADKALFKVFAPITVLRIGASITLACTVTAPVVDFDRRVLTGSDSGRVDQGVGRLTFPAVAGLVAGKVVYKDVRVDLNTGDEVVFELVTASTAGAALPVMLYIPRSEVPGNQADYLLGT